MFSFSPDGKRLAAGAGHYVDILDIATGRTLRRFDDHAGVVHTAAFSADGQTLFVCDGNITYWEVDSGEQMAHEDLGSKIGQRQINAAAVSADRKWVATAWADGRIRVNRWNTTEPEWSVPVGRHARALAISSEGRLVAVDSTEEGKHPIRVWSRERQEPVWELPGHLKPVSSLAFSPDGKRLYSGGHDGDALAWDLVTGARLQPLRDRPTIDYLSPVMSLAVSPDGKTVAVGVSRTELLLIDVADRKVHRRITRFQDYIRQVAFSPDGTTLTAAGRGNTVSLWDAATGVPRHEPAGQTSPIIDTAVSRDGRLLATLGQSGHLCLWDMADGSLKLRSRLRFAAVNSNYARLEFLPDGWRIAVTRGPRVLLWDSRTDKIAAAVPATVAAPLVAASPHGFVARAFEDGAVEIVPSQFDRDVAVKQKPLQMAGHRGAITALVIAPDGSTLASAGADKTLHVWGLNDGASLHKFDVPTPPTVLAFSADGRRLAGASGPLIQVWDVVTGKRLSQADTPLKSVRALAFSPDGKRLATAGRGEAIWLCDADTGEQLSRMAGTDAELLALAFSADGKRLAAAGADRTVRVYNVATLEVEAELTGHAAAVTAVRFVSPQGLASGNQSGEIFLWDTSRPKQASRKWHALGGVSDMMLSPDGKHLMAVGKAVALRFDVTDPDDRGYQLQTSFPDTISGSALSADGRRIAVSSSRRGLRVYDLDGEGQGKESAALEGSSPVFSADGRTLYFTPAQGGLTAWNLKTDAESFSIPLEVSGRVSVLAESPTRDQFVTQSDFGRAIQIWDAATQRLLRSLSFDPASYRTLRLSPDGRLLAGIRSQGTFELRELLTGLVVFRLPETASPPTTFSFVGNDTVVTGLSDGTAMLWWLRPPDWDSAEVARNADERALSRLWDELGSDEGPAAYRAFHSLVLLRERTVRFLDQQIEPAAGQAADEARIEALVADLGDPNPRLRRSVSETLRRLGPVAVPALRAALEGEVSERARVRIQLLLAAKPMSADEDVRALRAIHVLQRIATPAARELLAELADGSAAARPTREARAALHVLSQGSD